MNEIKFNNIVIYPEVILDEFSGTKNIFIKQQHMPGDYFIPTYDEVLVDLQFTFRNVGGEDFLVFRCEKSQYKLKQGDKIYFLFEGNELIEFLLINKAYNVPNDTKTLEILCQITVDELDTLSTKRLLKWKIKSNKENLEIAAGFNRVVHLFEFQKFIMEIAELYKEAVTINVDNYKPLKERTYLSQINSVDIKSSREKISQDILDAVWRRDEGKCVECGSREKLEFDHIIPLSKGGANTYRNIQLLCEMCNRKKSNKIG